MSEQETMSAKLSGALFEVFDGGARNRREYYLKNPSKRPGPGEVEGIISLCANQNALLTGGLSLIPGPWGLVAAVPEIVIVIRNQVRMIYDIGVAFGKEEFMTRELLLGIMLSATGGAGIGLLTIHGSKVLIKRTSLRMFQRLIEILGGRITQQLLKSSIAKWLPLFGAVVLATWTRYTTSQVGRYAVQILSKTIELEPAVLEEDARAPSAPVDAQSERIRLLANLMKVDGHSDPSELEYVEAMIVSAELTEAARDQLRAECRRPQQSEVDFGVFDGEDMIGLLLDLTALANRDGTLRPVEAAFIRSVAKRLGIPDEDVEPMLA